VEEEVLWWRRAVGIENPEPDKSDDSTRGSWEEVALDVEDVFETTDALWAARKMESSRVRRFTCRWSVDSRATNVHRSRRVNYSHGSFLPLPPAPFPAAYEAPKPSAVLGVAEGPGLARLQHPLGDSWATAAEIRETARLARGSADSRRPGWTAGYSPRSKTAMLRFAGWPTGDENACRLPAREAKEARSLDLASLLVLYQEILATPFF
jgi:hypothetical protein